MLHICYMRRSLVLIVLAGKLCKESRVAIVYMLSTSIYLKRSFVRILRRSCFSGYKERGRGVHL